MKRISSDTINDIHKFNDPKLLQNPTMYQPGKYIACYYDKMWDQFPLAKGQSARDYVLTVEDYNKILFHAQWQLKDKIITSF